MASDYKIPEFLPLMEQIKAIFSEELTTQQKNNYQCLVTWALKMPLLQQQVNALSVTQELKTSLIELLGPVQNALADIYFSIPQRSVFIQQLTETINSFYLHFDNLPTGRAKAAIIAAWQDVHGQGATPPILPPPSPTQPHIPSPPAGHPSIFDADEEMPWYYSDIPNLCRNSDDNNVTTSHQNTESE